mmetsp:Transcript_5873/g.14986  ORF Transcript_5873/g.14986 Transcript_5873/m.14986 type:complete len:207 (-) Transcript_5873:1207-1827(-)
MLQCPPAALQQLFGQHLPEFPAADRVATEVVVRVACVCLAHGQDEDELAFPPAPCFKALFYANTALTPVVCIVNSIARCVVVCKRLSTRKEFSSSINWWALRLSCAISAHQLQDIVPVTLSTEPERNPIRTLGPSVLAHLGSHGAQWLAAQVVLHGCTWNILGPVLPLLNKDGREYAPLPQVYQPPQHTEARVPHTNVARPSDRLG